MSIVSKCVKTCHHRKSTVYRDGYYFLKISSFNVVMEFTIQRELIHSHHKGNFSLKGKNRNPNRHLRPLVLFFCLSVCFFNDSDTPI